MLSRLRLRTRAGDHCARCWATLGARPPLARFYSPPPPPPVYAHEDLLLPSSTTKQSSSRRVTEEEPPLLPPSTSPLVPLSSEIPTPLPSSVLSNGLPNPAIRWRPSRQTSIQDDVQLYKQLGKFKLSSLVVLTTMAGYAICPVDPGTTHAAMDAFAQSLAAAGSSTPADAVTAAIPPAADGALGSSPANNLTLSVLLPTTVGTTLCAFSAASFNQLIEAPYDAQMARTRNRPLPKRAVTPLHAATYGALTGTVGLATLYAINPLSAALGLATIALYCPLYTISKRHTVYNTWIGSLVGGGPPPPRGGAPPPPPEPPPLHRARGPCSASCLPGNSRTSCPSHTPSGPRTPRAGTACSPSSTPRRTPSSAYGTRSPSSPSARSGSRTSA